MLPVLKALTPQVLQEQRAQFQVRWYVLMPCSLEIPQVHSISLSAHDHTPGDSLPPPICAQDWAAAFGYT